MHGHRASEPAVAARSNQVAAMTQSPVPAGKLESPLSWSDGRKRFLQLHQERYLQRLAILRDALLRDRNLVHLSLPKKCDKGTGFWEAIMEDINEAPTTHRFPTTKSQRPNQSSVGGSLSSEQNRRGHLERLRRIRIMQMRRRLPPQLEPVHGIGLGGKKEQRTRDVKQAPRVPPTAYHIDWMKGNHIITPVGDHEKAISSWALKHLRTIDIEPPNEAANNFPNDIRTLLRRTRHSTSPMTSVTNGAENKRASVAKTATIPPTRTHSPTFRKPSLSKLSAAKDMQLSTEGLSPRSRQQGQLSTDGRLSQSYYQEAPTPPAPTSSPTPQSPFMSEIISHHSSSSSRENSRTNKQESELHAEEHDTNDVSEVKLIDRASSPVGFRLPPLEQEKRTSISSSANSKRQIVVKIPHGIK